MPDSDLSRLLVGETERIEWKESIRNSNVVFRSVCALANDLGGTNESGYLVVGVKSNRIQFLPSSPSKACVG